MDAMAQPAGSETDMDWLDLANEPADDLLPPRKGQQKSSKSKKGKKGKSGGTMILGQEVHPGLIIGLGVGIILLVLSIIIRWALSDSRPDVSVELEAVTPEQARELYGGQPNGNNSSPGGNNQPASQNGGGNNNRASQDSNGASQNGSGNQINGNEQTAQPADPQNALANGNAVPSAPAMDNAPDPENGAAVTEPGTISNAVFTSPTDTSTVVAASAVGGPANMKDADAANALSAGSDRTSSNTGTSGARERIPFTVGDQITVGPPGCPVMVVGQQVWNKSEHSVVATLDGTRERDVLAALSPDGKYFAAAARHPNQQNTNVDVWETDTGRKLFTAAGTSGRYADAILLAPRSLYVGGRWSADLQRWNCANGNKAKAIPLTSASFRSSNTAVTSDGKYIAAVSNGRLGILQTTGGKIGGVMQSPENRPRASLRASAPTTAPDPGNERVYESLQCLRFSMDNAELAGVATFPVPRILCWESTGKLIVDRPFSGSANVARFNQLEWFSDGNAWLIAGNIIDRETGHILLASDEAFPNSVHIYDQSRLCGVFASNDSELLIREIPWDQIQGALAEVSNPDSALVSPAKPVSLHVSLDGRSNLESHVTRAMTKRLTADGIKIDDTTHDVAFRVQGDSATSQLTCELVIHGQSRWSALIPDVQALTTEFDSADTVQQKAMLDYVAEKIGGLAVPWFVPANDDLVMLPVALN